MGSKLACWPSDRKGQEEGWASDDALGPHKTARRGACGPRAAGFRPLLKRSDSGYLAHVQKNKNKTNLQTHRQSTHCLACLNFIKKKKHREFLTSDIFNVAMSCERVSNEDHFLIHILERRSTARLDVWQWTVAKRIVEVWSCLYLCIRTCSPGSEMSCFGLFS